MLGVGALGCGEGGPDPAATLAVEVRWPAGWGEGAAPGLRVVAVGGDGVRREASTDAMGVARFAGVAMEPYRLEAEVALDADRVFGLTGHRIATTARLSVEVAAGPGDVPVRVALTAPRLGGWVIGEAYYTGSPGVGGTHYFSDQFVELVNNSTEVLYADGLMVGDLHGPSGEINPGTRPTPFAARDPDHVYVANVWRVPGGGTDHPVPPGGSVVLAQDGTNHMPFSPLDLSDADWETYNARSNGRDEDSPTVPNLEAYHYTAGFDWLVTVFGPALVVFRVEAPDALRRERTTLGDRVVVPVDAVLDGFEALQDEGSAAFRRLPDGVDRGFVFASGTYTGESFERRVAARIGGRPVLVDTDDCAADFRRLDTPTPREFAD